MSNRLVGMMLAVSVAVMPLAGAAAAGPEIAWEETFDDPDCLDRARFYVWDRYNQGGWDDKLLIKQLKDGVFRYGLKYDKTRKQDWVCLVYGDIVWGHKSWPQWGPFDLRKYPILEIKWRGSYFLLHYGKETASGKKLGDYMGVKGNPNEWKISTLRLAADSSVPGPHTPVKLLGFNPMLRTPEDGKDRVVEIDYIRVRGLTAEEAAEEAKVIAVLSNFPKGRWRGFDDFFPWGIYQGYLRGDFESWGGDYEGAYGNHVRHRFNYAPSNDEVDIGRYGMDPQRYIAAMQRLVEAARATGIRLGAIIHRMTGMEYEDALRITRRLAKAFPDDDVVVSWKVYDEPGVNKLLPLAKLIRAVREADPLKRPELIEFNSTSKFGPYVPYLNLNCWDLYPIHGDHRSAHSVREIARDYRHHLPDRPMWVVLQAMDARPPVGGGFARPTDAEFRMMTYMSIAEGAKGVLWFIDWSGVGDFEGMVDRTGLKRGGMMDTLADLGARLIPVGKQLLATDVAEDAGISVVQRVEPAEGHVVQVSALKHRKDQVHFLVAVNEDLERPRSAEVALPRAILDASRGVYDLYALDGRNLAKDGGFTVSTLAGGDGRIYAVCHEHTFHAIRASILCKSALENVRILTPDVTIARRWGLDLGSVDRAIESCKSSAKASAPAQAMAKARLARELLFEAIGNNSRLNTARRALCDIQKELAEVSHITEYFSRTPRWWTGGDHRMMIPNPGFLELSKRYWEIGRSYRDCYARYLAGDKQGLWEEIAEMRGDCLKMREDVLAFLRAKLKPEQEPGDSKQN